MSHKRLFSRSLEAAPDRLHFAAHSHHLWPDASREGQVACWDDAARLADLKWDRVMGEVWPEAARHVATELGMGGDKADRIVFAANTHDFILRLAAAAPRRARGPLRVLASDGEFHSARRQFARWLEAGEIILDTVPTAPWEDFAERFTAAAKTGRHDLVMVSQVMFGTGRVTAPIEPIVELADPDGPWVVIDGYHSFMAIDAPFGGGLSDKAFFLGGGYKYAMAGEGMGFMSCPPGFGDRPPLTGWFAEFEDLTLPPGMVGYASNAMRFMGATFDPSALYRWNAVRAMLEAEGLDTAGISAQVAALQQQAVDVFADTPLADAELLNPLGDGPHARFLAYRHEQAAAWCDALKAEGVVTDVRGDVIRFGFGLYHDADDVAALARALRGL
ncbi:kynureninase/PvdN C-terminal domain-containing protein [Sphingomicrobium aestuariivivum]|uniref:kynureninase/PvdN C-terminal domain-containing protein n=1 Tax=Sphingomicrobium aestuariivivum TaxID=1582356 RepID=UPI001FD6B90D|nr:class V aminotransferase [Sphingomicrobium aestuariivivum]MCJ8191212.1 class V aminotransferase [Sphingomicrobium aestuariivivum]